jgi:hypothetical protein
MSLSAATESIADIACENALSLRGFDPDATSRARFKKNSLHQLISRGSNDWTTLLTIGHYWNVGFNLQPPCHNVLAGYLLNVKVN